jgi:AcrR family transcriptional regulator
MTKIKITPRKKPSQQRSAGTVKTILEAAARILAKESLAGFNTNRVAEVAGISVGSVYQYFPNKDAMIAALIEREHEQVISNIELMVQKLRGRSLTQCLKAMAQLAVAQQYSQPLLAAALDHEERRLPMQLEEVRTFERISKALDVLLAAHRTDLPTDLPACAGFDCLLIAKALVESNTSLQPSQSPDLERRVFRALLGYLTVRVNQREKPD